MYSDAYATTFTATQSGDWTDPNTWGGATPPVTSNLDNTIIIPSGITVTVPIGDTVTNNGLIINSGTIENMFFFVNSGNITNSGTITNLKFICLGDGCPTNVIITNNANAIITNSGIISIEQGLLNNFGSLDNSNNVTNDGIIDNSGMLTNEPNGTITNIFFTGIIKNHCISTFTNNGSITNNTIMDLCPPCTLPVSGDFTITSDCKISNSAVTPSKVIVQNNALLFIPSGKNLHIDFKTKHLLIKSGSRVLIKAGGKLD